MAKKSPKAATGPQIVTTLGQLVMVADDERQGAAVRPSLLERMLNIDGYSAKARYHLVKLARLVTAEVAHFRTERAQLFEQLGDKRPSRTPAELHGGPTVHEVPKEKVPEFTTRINELVAVEVTLPWGPIPSTDLPLAVTAADVNRLVDAGLCELVDPEAAS